jgi:two-component system CheB/CheR fusion protein
VAVLRDNEGETGNPVRNPPRLPETCDPVQAAEPLLSPSQGAEDLPATRQDHGVGFIGYVVGIGASAGGLDALERLFGALPSDTGAAFVVVQHLSPDHKSMMDNLLARYTAMPVKVVEPDMPLAPNNVYLIPPGRTLRLAGNRLQLTPKPEHGLALPIDIFFGSLAEQCADRALAVVLSGTGSDGSRGVVSVNAAGGFVYAQEVIDARFDGMPRSAIATGLVDVVAPAPELARKITERINAPRAAQMRLFRGDAEPALVQPLDAILSTLLSSSGVDFRDYKSTTVLRRIERRMQVLHMPTLGAYRDHLQATALEQVLLRRELLIPVTRFFLDSKAFDVLADSVLPNLVARDLPDEPIRVWVAACATGEEAYSIAILFAEAFERAGRSRAIKIFATDVEPHYLEIAAVGQYPDTIAAEVSGARLERYFVERNGGWAVRQEIRQMVIFARHNLVADPPFTRMNLVSCRNALIYFQPAAQEQALRRLQYALLPGGHLLQGPSESLGVMHREFAALSGRHKVYRLLQRGRLVLTSLGSRSTPLVVTRRAGPEVASEPQQWVAQGQRQLHSQYTPPSLLVGANRELLHVYGDGKALLRIGEGAATLDVLKLLPRELSWACSLLLQAVASDSQAQSAAPVAVGEGEERRQLRVVARRLVLDGSTGMNNPVGNEHGLTLLSFEPLNDSHPASAAESAALDMQQHQRVETLERELAVTHQTLQSTIEELETANEELQATNEELQATNEELMASNEELQSTNEELQSVNEELYTVNSEYQEKVDVLNAVNADLENVSKAAAIPTLFVDADLCLTRFTPELAQLFKVRETDRGRCIEDFVNLLDYPELFTDLRRTLAGGSVTEREVQSRDGRWWLARIQPYLSRAPGSTRAVMTFVDVTSLKDSQRLQAVIDSLAEHVAVLDNQGTITMVNHAWRRFAAENGDPGLTATGPGSNYLKASAQAALLDPDALAAHQGLTEVLAAQREGFQLQYPCHTADRKLWFLMQVAPIRHPVGGAVVSHIDITPWAQAHEQALAGSPQGKAAAAVSLPFSALAGGFSPVGLSPPFIQPSRTGA